MKAIYPKFIQTKANLLGMELMDFFIIGPYVLFVTIGIVNIKPIFSGIGLIVYILLRKTVLKRPKGHGKFLLQSLSRENFLYIKRKSKK